MHASDDAVQSALRQIPRTADAIISARNLVKNGLSERLAGEPVSCSDQHFHNYLRLMLVNRSEERMLAIFLDSSDLYIHSEVISRGGRHNLVLRTRELFHRALDVAAASLIIAHNHPSGSPEPSREDVQATEQMAMVSECLDLRLIDHLIVSHSGIFSLRAGRLL